MRDRTRRVDQLNIVVRNVEAAANFYDFLGNVRASPPRRDRHHRTWSPIPDGISVAIMSPDRSRDEDACPTPGPE